MIPYLIVFFLCLVLNQLSTNKRKTPVILSCLLLSLFAGFRDVTVGSDTDFYPHFYISELPNIKSFANIVFLDTILDKGFLFLYWFGSWFGNQYWIGLFLVEFVVTLFTFGAYFRLSRHFGRSIFIFTFAFLFLIYNYTLNAMRQECAISIAFLAFSYLIEKRWVLFFIWTGVAYTFHSSSIVTLIFPVMLYISNIEDKRKRNLFISLILCAGVFVFSSLFSLVHLVGELGLLNADHINAYASGEKFEAADRVAYVPLLISIIIYFFIYLAYKRNILDKKFVVFHLLMNTFYLFSLFLSLVSIYLYRVGLFFYIVDIYMLSVIVSSKKINFLMRTFVVIIFVLYWAYLYVIQNNSETVPYTSRILGI